MKTSKILGLIAISLLISSSFAAAQSTEEIKSRIAELFQQLSTLQRQLEAYGPKLECSNDSDCNWCGMFCVHKDIAKYCLQVMPPVGYNCGCENGRCIAKRVGSDCIRGRPSLQINPPSRTASPGEQVIYQGIIRSTDSSACESSSFSLEINCPQGFECSVSPNEIITSSFAYAYFRIVVKSPQNASEGEYTFVVKAINKANTSLVTEARGFYIIKKEEKEDVPKGTLRIDKKVARVGENITISIDAEDENGLESIMAYFLGKWNTKQCNKEKTCNATFTFVENTPGIKFYYGYVRGYSADGKKVEGSFTRPPFVDVRVVAEEKEECIRGAPYVNIEPDVRKVRLGEASTTFSIIVRSTDKNCDSSSFKIEVACPEQLECLLSSSTLTIKCPEPLRCAELPISEKLILNVKLKSEISVGNYSIKVKAINEADNSLVGEATATLVVIKEEAESRAQGFMVADKDVVKVGGGVTIAIVAKDDNGLHSISLYTPQREWKTIDCNKSTNCGNNWTFVLEKSGIYTYYGIIRGYRTDGSLEISYTIPPMIVVRAVEEIPRQEIPGRAIECSNDSDCMWCGTSCIRKTERIFCPAVMPPRGYSCVCDAGKCVAKI